MYNLTIFTRSENSKLQKCQRVSGCFEQIIMNINEMMCLNKMEEFMGQISSEV